MGAGEDRRPPPRSPLHSAPSHSRATLGTGYTRPDLEPLSYDDLPLGGEWTTRRRTISDAEIALFAGVAGDLSPLTIEAPENGRRPAPPALVVALAVGLGSVDTPVPSVAEWAWLNWKFPRPVHAGDTIYARWTLTQKRPPVGGAPSSIIVWRVDVHTQDGALCAEGEIGAKVRRGVAVAERARPAAAEPPSSSAAPRRRRRRPRANGSVPEPPPVAAPPAATAKPERAAGPSRRRRRRRPSGSGAREEEHEPRAAHVPETSPTPAVASPAPVTTPGRPATRSGLGGVLRRLRRPPTQT
jgi:acyl dehydratase